MEEAWPLCRLVFRKFQERRRVHPQTEEEWLFVLIQNEVNKVMALTTKCYLCVSVGDVGVACECVRRGGLAVSSNEGDMVFICSSKGVSICVKKVPTNMVLALSLCKVGVAYASVSPSNKV